MVHLKVMRNPDILIDVYELFTGSLMAFEDNFLGTASNFSDEELIQYIKEWAQENGTDLVLVMYKFEPTYWQRVLPALPFKVLSHMRGYYSTDQGFPHPSYKDQILQVLNEEIKVRGH